MARFLHYDLLPSVRRIHGCILAVFWTTGLLSGIWAFFSAGTYFPSLMRSTMDGSVSIVSLLFVTFLPFLLSASAVFLSGNWLVFLVVFCKGFLVTFVALGFVGCFGCSGWLFRLLLCFSGFCCGPVLYWYWRRVLVYRDRNVLLYTGLAFSLCLLIGSIDYCLISPFIRDLIYL